MVFINNSRLNHSSIISFGFDNEGYIYAGTSGGVYRSTSSTITSINSEKNNYPSDFQLYQNYPNPFNPSTTFSYFLSHPGKVIFEIYNVQGQLVENILNEKKSFGLHFLQWQTKNLPSGLYIYRLSFAGFSKSKKLLILK
ncbi:T9SS type A sorting domain-containing protein [Calditrichota bacterium]